MILQKVHSLLVRREDLDEFAGAAIGKYCGGGIILKSLQ
jgi:hypothetical protein